MLHLQLKEKTRGEHASLEKYFLGVIRTIDTRHAYARFLAKIYGYYSVAEATLKPYLDDSIVKDFGQRIKSDLIAGDLGVLTKHSGVFPVCQHLPPINSFHSALGTLYVFEGSTLGGQIIARMIGERLNTREGLSFFLSYGDQTTEMWDKFRSFLNEPFSAEQQEETVTAATATFVTFKQWLQNA
jgi:heme oxygenase (biliverdin-IX-beta and delta-forming)